MHRRTDDEGRRRLAAGLVVAVVTHGVVVFIDARTEAPFAPTPLATVEIEIAAPEPPAGPIGDDAPQGASPSLGAPSRGGRSSVGRSTPVAQAATESPGEVATGQEGSSAASPPRAIDLGIGRGAWAKWMPEQPAPATPPPAAPRVASTTGGLREALEARDLELGLGPAGTVLTAAREAAYADVAPQIGTALFSAVILRSGEITVALESCNRDAADWTRVADVLRGAIRRKPPRIAGGRSGVALTIEIKAEQRWPNGTSVEGEAPHVAVDLPELTATDQARDALAERNPLSVAEPPRPSGVPLKLDVKLPGIFVKGRGKICSYAAGITPFGFGASGGCDPSNVGARAMRVVATRIVSQSAI
jgi:hypothetical protein